MKDPSQHEVFPILVINVSGHWMCNSLENEAILEKSSLQQIVFFIDFTVELCGKKLLRIERN